MSGHEDGSYGGFVGFVAFDGDEAAGGVVEGSAPAASPILGVGGTCQTADAAQSSHPEFSR